VKYFYLILIALVLALPIVLHRSVASQNESTMTTKDVARLVVVTVHNGDIRREYDRAFGQWYAQHYGQPAVLDFRVPGGTTDMIRFLKSQSGNWSHGSPCIVWGGGDFTYYHDLQPANLLQPIHLNPKLLAEAFPKDTLAGVRLYDPTKDKNGQPTPMWVGVVLSSFGIVYNPELYTALNLPAPTAWADLTDPKLFGLVALADPAHSGSAAVAYMMVIQRAMADSEQQYFAAHLEDAERSKQELKKRKDYQQALAAGWKRGMGQLLLIAANARYFTDSSERVPTDVGRGEAAAGVAIDFYARVTEDTVGPQRARYVAPAAATAITPDAVAILKGVSGQDLILATRFVEFLLSPEAQRLWILKPGQPGGPIERSIRRMPIRRDVYANQTGWADQFNPFTEAGGFNQRGEWMALMTDTRPLWDTAWIDTRDELLAAYKKILSVRDEPRRRELLSELADIPFTMSEIEARQSERKKLESTPGGDGYEWQVKQRIEWGQRLRSHYANAAKKAL
jgi:ABC-type Fe3+ transport system substrate-binding protein